MNYFGVLAVIAGSLSIGICKAREEKRQTLTLRELCSFLEIMKNEICAEKLTLIKFISQDSLNEFGLLSEFIASLRNSISELGERRFCSIWCDCVTEELKLLPEKSKCALLSLGNCLGKHDSEIQKLAIERCMQTIQDEYSEKEKALKNNEKMYIGLGGCAGIILALMLI